MSEKLKPCPFCLAELVATTSSTLFEHPLNECFLEGCLVSAKRPFQVYAWNTRNARGETIEECVTVIANNTPMEGCTGCLTRLFAKLRALKEA